MKATARSVETAHGPVIEVRLPDGSTRTYRDACPHTGRRLSDDPNRVLTREADRLICFGHGALFRLEDGVCVAGPCVGERLELV
ncbi:hypothetical protein BH09PSE2_BH09PSE2_26400 [soil metagenome]